MTDALQRSHLLGALGGKNFLSQNWGKGVGALVRTSDDIKPTWGQMLHVFDSAANRPLYAQPGSCNDPDTLYVGHGVFDAANVTEARSHVTL